VLIESVYIGFAVADGCRAVIGVETTITSLFVVVAAAGVTETPWCSSWAAPATAQGSLAAPPPPRR
jgi:hypothetical protein